MESKNKLFSAEFVAINLIVFLNYCNIALFFYFSQYLVSIGISGEWSGFLIAIFSLVILLIRPVISPFSNPENSRKWLIASTFAIMVALLCYGWALDVISMTLVRIFHGVAYVVMTVAITSRMVASIPVEKSSLAFSIVSVISLLPYAIVPPGVVYATDALGSFPRALGLGALLMGLTFPLLALIPDPEETKGKKHQSSLSAAEMKKNLMDVGIMVVLLVAVVVWTTYAPVFFFLTKFGDSIGVANPGLFFTISSLAEIGIRLVGGRFMDRGNKPILLMAAVSWLGVCYFVMGWFIQSEFPFYFMGLLMGLGWGLVMPLLSSIVFDISEPRFRAFNTNITFQMFQLGFFIGPIAGTVLIQSGGFSMMFIAGSSVLFLSAILALGVFRRHPVSH